jgi:hypothetical protein
VLVVHLQCRCDRAFMSGWRRMGGLIIGLNKEVGHPLHRQLGVRSER